MLVHCYAGQSRSVALVLAYLCSALRMQLSDAYQLVLSARPSARPNSGGNSPTHLAYGMQPGCIHFSLGHVSSLAGKCNLYGSASMVGYALTLAATCRLYATA